MWLMRALLVLCSAQPLLATFESCVCQQETCQHLANLVSLIPADRNVARGDWQSPSEFATLAIPYLSRHLAGAAARVPTGMCVGSHERANNMT